jgi:hypothetical protein
VAATDLDHRLLADLLQIGAASVQRNRSTQPGAGQVQEIADHPLDRSKPGRTGVAC